MGLISIADVIVFLVVCKAGNLPSCFSTIAISQILLRGLDNCC